MKPPAIAKTFNGAAYQIRHLVAPRLLEYMGLDCPVQLSPAEPPIATCHARDEEWLEGNWSLKLRAPHFNTDWLQDINACLYAAQVESVHVVPKGDMLELTFWISARILEVGDE